MSDHDGLDEVITMRGMRTDRATETLRALLAASVLSKGGRRHAYRYEPTGRAKPHDGRCAVSSEPPPLTVVQLPQVASVARRDRTDRCSPRRTRRRPECSPRARPHGLEAPDRASWLRGPPSRHSRRTTQTNPPIAALS